MFWFLMENLSNGSEELHEGDTSISKIFKNFNFHQVTFTEFLAATIDITKLKDNENVLKHVYQLLDADNSGVLQADDLADMFPNNSQEALDAVMAESGAGADGLTFEQFKNYILDASK